MSLSHRRSQTDLRLNNAVIAKSQQPVEGGKRAKSKHKGNYGFPCLIPSHLQLRTPLSLTKDLLLTI
jgi:hypothetical protein